jgi:nucleoside-diphosphate-sugar epimerase
MVIGASGHIGSYLVPELRKQGHEVVAVSRGRHSGYRGEARPDDGIRELAVDRDTLCRDVAMLRELRLDAVCDTQAFNRADAELLCAPFLDTDTHIVAVGSNWCIGYKMFVPVTEEHPRTETGEYGRGKAEVEAYLTGLSAAGKLRGTVVHPGHVTGQGWLPVNPQGNFERDVYRKIIGGEAVLLPDDGMATLQHVHAADLAALICRCLARPEQSTGEAFFATAPEALTLRGYAELLYANFGQKPNLLHVDWPTFAAAVGPEVAACSEEHLRHSPVCSMAKAKRLLDFEPAYHAIDAVMDALVWQIDHSLLT